MPARRLTIVALGDSTTAGTPGFLSPVEAPPDGRGDPESQYSHWIVKAHPEWTVLNRGVNRERSDQILRRVGRDALAHAPQYVIVLAGINDVYQGRPAEQTKADLLAIYSEVSRAGPRLVVGSVLPYNRIPPRQVEALRDLNAWIRETAVGQGLLWCDSGSSAADPVDPMRLAGSPDGLHPDVAGYRRMGEAFAQVIERAERA
ncbi:MAG: SGNH/GDSL hydrolase family protein [Thermoplasmata archaeon]|nr:SGNH/GDSL hydrolase family protein [Thermoplasmata archaeon]